MRKTKEPYLGDLEGIKPRLPHNEEKEKQIQPV